MSLIDITKKIITDAEKEAEKIRKDGQKEIEKILAVKNQEIVAVARALKDKAAEKAGKIKEQAEFKKRQISKNETLKAKQELISRVFDGAKEILSDLDGEEYVKLIYGLLKKSQGLDKAEIITANKRRELIAKALKLSGCEYKLSEKKLPAGKDGFILSSKSEEINYTFNNLVSDLKSETEREAANILFGQ